MTDLLDATRASGFDPMRLGFANVSPPDVINGTDGNDNLVGTSGDDTINGLGGNDTIHGGSGNDSLDGGAGDDLLYGGPGSDTLVGGQGNDILHGGQGADLLQGGAGDDGLFAGHSGTTLDGGAGDDTVSFAESKAKDLVVNLETGVASDSHGSFSLISIENVTGLTTGASVTGDDGDNGLGGSGYSDTLDGGAGNDTITGGGGRDTITGGAGADVMYGGHAADTFVFNDVSDSPFASPDIIGDLEHKDVIDLSAIDADTTTAGNQAFTIVDAFTGHAGQLVLHTDSSTGESVIDGDANGDGQADFRIEVGVGVAIDCHFVL